VAPATHRCVDHQAGGNRVEQFHHLARHDRPVLERRPAISLVLIPVIHTEGLLSSTL